MLFHALLALHPHSGLFSFSTTMTALFTAFLPLNIAQALKPGETLRKAWPWGIIAFGSFLIVWLSRSLLLSGARLEKLLEDNIAKVGFLGYYAYLAVGLIIFFRAQKMAGNEIRESEGRWKKHPALILFPLVLVINGFGPYFGFKTVTSFSMFSNLQTENGMTNHLIMPSGIQFTSWQYDLVEIIDSNDRHLISAHDRDLLVVYLELRRMRTTAGPDFWVIFRRKGRNEIFEMKRPETHDVLPPLGPFGKRYFHFRNVDRDPMRSPCQW
jgi:hypothetical protein